jgi:8-oxo-dGTP pyrophosphatase MutT (NUDIX family)
MLHPFKNDLHNYHSAFAEEQIFITRSKELWQQSAELAFQRTHFLPGHFTASAFVVNEARTKTLLIEHPKYSIWVQPGGHIEEGETPAQAALREAKEETGLHQVFLHPELFDIDIHPIPAKGSEPEHEHFDLRFLIIAKEDEMPGDNENIHTKWIPLSEIAEYTNSRSVLRLVEKLF